MEVLEIQNEASPACSFTMPDIARDRMERLRAHTASDM
jgi:hypothetical protein